MSVDSYLGINFNIYVATSEEISNLLSANTVSYRSAVDIISEYLSIIKIPIWLIGLGIEKL